MKRKTLRCCVPFCERSTTRTEFSEWLCGDHWKLIERKHRRVYGRYVRQWRRYKICDAPEAASRLWRWMKRRAIERAAMI